MQVFANRVWERKLFILIVGLVTKKQSISYLQESRLVQNILLNRESVQKLEPSLLSNAELIVLWILYYYNLMIDLA